MISRNRLKTWLMHAALAVIVCIVTFAVIEGVCSVCLLAWDLVFRPNPGFLPSRVYMEPDTLVGWVNEPHKKLPNVYAPHVGLTINSQSMRGSVEYDSAAPAGKLRVLCSGDSFTFGVGVDDDHTWCADLEKLDSRLQSVNLGHTGWGIDQSYLFYKRTAPKLEHSVHVLAFITDDLRRLRARRFTGYPKPLFQLHNNRLVLTGVPVPKPSRLGLWFTYNGEWLAKLRAVQLGQRVLLRGSGPRATEATSLPEGLDIMVRLFEDLYRTGQQHGQSTVFVMLESNAKGTELEEQVRQFLIKELGRRGIPFIDLWSEFHHLPDNTFQAMLDPKWGHYTPQGYAYTAAEIYRRLIALPEVKRQLSALGATPSH